MDTVTAKQLEAIAGTAPVQPQASSNGYHGNGTFDIDAWLSRSGLELHGPEPYQGGRKWILPTCPWNSSHTGGSAFVIQRANGLLQAGCHHNGCSSNDWHTLRELFEPGHRERRNGSHRAYSHHDESEASFADDQSTPEPGPTDSRTTGDKPDEIRPVLIGQLIDDHPRLNEPMVDGLIRAGETCNIISVSKVGKSWLAIMLALCIALGRRFLDTFDCKQARVLYLDNELHPPTIAHRFQTVADAMGIFPDQYRMEIDVLSLRGRLKDIHGIRQLLETVEPQSYGLLINDAFYRSLPAGVDENANTPITGIYNTIDRITARLQCSWVNIHHASKGNQSEKSVTDTGAGAGAQSRAADTHLILRPHQDDGAVVLEAVTRSFPPVQPVALRWNFPLWTPDGSLDPKMLKGKQTASEQRQADRDHAGMLKLAEALEQGEATIKVLRGRSGLSKDRCERLLDQLEASGSVKWNETIVRGNTCRVYQSIDLDGSNGDSTTPF